MIESHCSPLFVICTTITIIIIGLSEVCTIKQEVHRPCYSRDYGHGSIVCVCNSTYCDTFRPQLKPTPAILTVYESNKEGKRFFETTMKFTYGSNLSGQYETVVVVNKSQKFQEVLGFGGAFTDAAGINIVSLPKEMQDMLISSYYSVDGLEYSIGRVPIASCDFSTHDYSYDDIPGDFNLTYFQLTKEDHLYKIPFIQKAMEISSFQILFFGSPWSSPAWMKTNENMTGKGTLKGEVGGKYYETWANYFVRFLKAYAAYNIMFWGITAENEPLNGFRENFPFQCLGFTPESQRDFIKFHLGPTLEKAGFGPDKLKLMIMDDQRPLLPKWAEKVLQDPVAAKYVSGIGFHWYMNSVAPAKLLDITHKMFPSKFILATEACEGSFPWQINKVILGSWERAESYAHDIIQDLLHWSVGWVDWNLALDLGGGPNWVNNFVDSPIIVNATAKEFYKQPMYYVLGHFSKFIPRGSYRIGVSQIGSSGLEVAAFMTVNRTLVLVVVNRNANPVNLMIMDPELGHVVNTVSSHSIQTYIWHGKK
ncbi:lysosomal acid glucosylceramidase-like [Tachypleus tridentatus]|uniref:lysosomal acid glucosylceramidase-like n=1 Tax=Tachypleus tridentatus TaxID=6853 RepID=UPI003FD3BCDD